MIKPNLNGWQRLWIFFCAIWFLLVAFIGYIEQPLRDGWYTAPQVALMSIETRDLTDKASKGGGISFQVPGYRDAINLPAGTSEAIQLKVAKEFYELSTAEYRNAVYKHWEMIVLTAIIPCIVILLIGMGISWVRVGFQK